MFSLVYVRIHGILFPRLWTRVCFDSLGFKCVRVCVCSGYVHVCVLWMRSCVCLFFIVCLFPVVYVLRVFVRVPL